MEALSHGLARLSSRVAHRPVPDYTTMTSTVPPYVSSTVPPITIEAYAERLAKWTLGGVTSVLIALALLERYEKRNAAAPINALTQHRLLLAALVVGCKMHHDAFYNNAIMARIGGVTLGELSKLELAFLHDMDYAVLVSSAELNAVAGRFSGLTMACG